MDFILDQLRDVQLIRARKMFGEYALYCGDKVVALVCDDQLFVKITEPGKAPKASPTPAPSRPSWYPQTTSKTMSGSPS